MENGGDADDVKPYNESKSNAEEIITALCDFTGEGEEQLSFSKGDHIKILQKTTESWWWAEINGKHGYVPANYVSSPKRILWQDEEYFGNYGNLKLHHEMLKDHPRTMAYFNAIVSNADFLDGKVVLDIGCGTGILSMMCAKHGNPKMVYAVEASVVAEQTKHVIEENGLSDKIKVIHGYAEDVVLDSDVDIIISEWMGTVLLFEMMIESVINMRDRYLKVDGVIWPSTASLYLVPCSANEKYNDLIGFWDTQFGFDYSCFKDVAKEDLLSKPFHNYILPKEDCLCSGEPLFQLDMKSVTVQCIEEISSDFSFTITKPGVSLMHGFCAWFEVIFNPSNPDGIEVSLNTGPHHDLTHWKQNLFLLNDPMKVKQDDIVSGTFTLSRNPEFRRHLRAILSLTVHSGNTQVEKVEKLFYIWR
ncbi:class I-like SAM-binding methyltransferase superfamily [Mactra antiquata]